MNHLSFFQRFLLPLSLVTSPNPTFPAFQVYVPPPEALRTGKVTDGAIVRKDFASSKMLARDNVFKRPSSGGSSSSSSTGSASVFTQPIPSVFRVDQVSTLPFFSFDHTPSTLTRFISLHRQPTTASTDSSSFTIDIRKFGLLTSQTILDLLGNFIVKVLPRPLRFSSSTPVHDIFRNMQLQIWVIRGQISFEPSFAGFFLF